MIGKQKSVLLRAASNQYEGEGMEITSSIEWDQFNEHHSSSSAASEPVISSNLNTKDSSCLKTINSVEVDTEYIINKIESYDDDTVATFDSDETDFYEEEENDISVMPFRVLGTTDESDGRVLSPTNMESLQSFFPFSKAEDNFWLRYSMVRDGDSMYTFQEHAGRSKYSILAIETTDGEVFGAFTAEPWKKDWNYFGTGETFLWKMRNPRVRREGKNNNRINRRRNCSLYNHTESELDIYPSTGDNEYFQLCNHDKIAIGGGYSTEIAEGDNDRDDHFDNDNNDAFRKCDLGHGLYIGNDMRYGISSPCVTFRSPSLSKTHSDGSLFEIANLELWALTPCTREEDANLLERSIQFVAQHY